MQGLVLVVYHYGRRVPVSEHGPCEDCGGCVTPAEFHLVADVGGAVKPGQCVEQVVIPGDFRRWSAGESALLWSLAVGVGKNEKPFPVVWCANIGCSYTCPPCIPPDAGKVFQDFGESTCDMSTYIFEDCESWSKMLNCIEDMGPEMPFVVGAFAVSCLREWLARLRIASGKNVYWLAISNLLPVHAGHVAKVGNAWVVVLEDAGRSFIDFSEPHGLRIKHLHNTHF